MALRLLMPAVRARVPAAVLLLSLCGACSPAPSPTPVATPTPVLQPTASLPLPTLTRVPTPSVSVLGRWVGGYDREAGTNVSLVLTIETATQGTLMIEPETLARPLTELNVQGDEVRFNLIDAAGTLSFSGRWLAGEKIIGEVDEAGKRSEIVLNRWLEAAPVEDYAGVYVFPSGRALSLLPSPGFTLQQLDFFGGDLMVADFESSALRAVYAVAPDTLLVGAARGLGFPFIARINVDRNGSTAVAGLVWQALDPVTGLPVGEAETGTRLTPRVEAVNYTGADGTSLAGQLVLPDTPGPHPVFVMLHGSERGRRNGFGQQLMGAFMVSQGIGLLSYDKRGVGDSGGIYRESADSANLTLLAQDAVAGVEYLRTRSDVDADHLGLIGASQAGWVVPLAASQSSEVDLFVILSGPTVSVGHETLYSRYANDGESPPGLPPDEISKLLAALSPSGFDPGPVLASLTQPGLWLWGDQDQSVPVPESAARLEALIAGGRTNFSYVVFAHADHSLQQSAQGLLAEIPFSTGFTNRHYATLREWLNQHIP